MKQNLSTFLIFTIVVFIGSGCIPPDPDPKKCEPKWFSKRQTGEGIIYGVGLGDASNRRVAKDLSWSKAAADVNAQIRSRVINEVKKTFYETYTTVDDEDARSFIDGVKNNLFSKTDRPLDGCIIEKYADCEENNVWSAYTLVQFNFFRWRKTILKGIFDEELSKAADEINAQKNEFLKEMVSTSSLTII